MMGQKCAWTFAATIFAAGLVASVADPSSARAQCRLCEAPTTEGAIDPAKPLQLEVQSRLDFDRIVFSGFGNGEVAVSPGGQTQIGGAVDASGARTMPGTVVIRGEPGRSVRVELPRRVFLTGDRGSTIVIDSLVTDLPPLAQIGPDGVLSFRFGGALKIIGDGDGNFRGDVDIIVEYL